jgi:hypothetical protein
MDAAPRRDYQNVTAVIDEPRYRLSEAQFSAFWQDGYLGPFTCDDPNVGELPILASRAGLRNHGDGLPIPPLETWDETDALHINVHDPHVQVPEIMGLGAHPSIVNPVAQLLGSREIAFLQSRFRVKFRERADPVPWHQDVGENNGGYRADGSPVPSVTVWLSADGADESSGALLVIPGTHKQLYGNWRSGFHSLLDVSRDLASVDTSRTVSFDAAPGEFYLFHSWILHLSTANASTSPRTGLVMRFVTPSDAVQPHTDYTTVTAG